MSETRMFTPSDQFDQLDVDRWPTTDEAAGARRSPGLWRRVGRDSVYLLTAFPLAVVGFVVAVAGWSAGVSVAVLGVGLVVLVGTVLALRGLAFTERARLRSLQGREAQRPVYRVPSADAGRVRRLLTPLADPQSWLDSLWALVSFPTAVASFCVVVSTYATIGGGLTYWFWQRYLPNQDELLVERLGLGRGEVAESWLMLSFGAVALVLLPVLTRACAVVHGSVADALLCGRARLQAEVARVSGSRDDVHRAEADSLRRLERDIHDGPQQRLVRLSIDLGRARQQLGKDPDRAGQILDDAVRQSRETVAELRSLSRGIAPPLLVDRGLAAALGEMLQRSPVPVQATLEVPEPLELQVETSIYYVVSEALTNVAKHSSAAQATVRVRPAGPNRVVEGGDDGVGGADSALGSGLAGLRQRLNGVDGTLEISSPTGGPTLLRAVVPLRRPPGGTT